MAEPEPPIRNVEIYHIPDRNVDENPGEQMRGWSPPPLPEVFEMPSDTIERNDFEWFWDRIKYIGRIAFAISVMFLLIIIPYMWYTHTHQEPVQKPRSYSLHDVIHGRYQVPPLNSSWHGNLLLQKNAAGDLVLYNVRSGEENAFHSNQHNALKGLIAYSISPDSKFALITTKKLLDRPVHTILSLRSNASKRMLGYWDNTEDHIEYATFGRRQSQIAFVRSNNVYYLPSAVQSNSITLLTHTGSKTVRNGMCSEAYARDIFGHTHAMWFSPDGQHLAIAEFSSSHPDGLKRYATVTEPLEHVRLLVINLGRARVEPGPWIELRPPRYIRYEANPVLVAVGWTLPGFKMERGSHRVVSAWQNRPQSELFVHACTGQGNCSMIYSDYKNTGWQLVPRPVMVDDEISHEMIILTGETVGRNSYGIMAYAASRDPEDRKNVMFENKGKRQISSDMCTVLRLVHWDTRHGVLFYIGNIAEQPEDRHLFSVLTAQFTPPTEVCLTCDLIDGYTHFDAHFSSYDNYVLLEALGPQTPRRVVYEWKLDVNTNITSIEHVRTLDTIEKLRHGLRPFEKPVVERYDVPLLMGKMWARVTVTYPPDVRNDSRMYPMMLHPHDAPNSFAGTSEWAVGFDEYLAVNRSVAVVRIAGRGSSGRGLGYAEAVFGKLGLAEAEDVLEVVRYLVTMNGSRFDGARVGIYGAQYSGFVAGLTLAIDSERLIRCGAALEPLIEWMTYSALYAERFMGRLIDHQADYANASLIRWSGQIADYALFLSHSRNEDSRRFTRELELQMEKEDVRLESSMYRLGFYPYGELQKFFDRCFFDKCN